jgi:hypothetical protein
MTLKQVSVDFESVLNKNAILFVKSSALCSHILKRLVVHFKGPDRSSVPRTHGCEDLRSEQHLQFVHHPGPGQLNVLVAVATNCVAVHLSPWQRTVDFLARDVALLLQTLDAGPVLDDSHVGRPDSGHQVDFQCLALSADVLQVRVLEVQASHLAQVTLQQAARFFPLLHLPKTPLQLKFVLAACHWARAKTKASCPTHNF